MTAILMTLAWTWFLFKWYLIGAGVLSALFAFNVCRITR